MNNEKYTNKLAGQTSPYLLQHAHNPVNWYPWTDEAIEKAKKEDKPIFLSIGYSTCYWCHAMEKESFEDEDIAKILNDNFISIKVDREERPDIDELYMLAGQILNGRGGWPSSTWLNTDLKPWLAGSYFPKQQFTSILNISSDYWNKQRHKVEQLAENLTGLIKQASFVPFVSQRVIDAEPLNKAIKQYTRIFDEDYGGFDGAPKFPPHGALRFLIEQFRQTHNEALLHMITRTLDSIWMGGIHDHIGGGFHRYSTDEFWPVPHFEKMLYDNAQLIRSFTDAFLLTNQNHYRLAVEDIFNWLQDEMISPEGAFYTALDAGEFGKEGEFYLWQYKEIFEALGDKDAQIFAKVYNLSPDGNFTEERSGEKTGNNIIYLRETIKEIAKSMNEDPQQFAVKIADLRTKLLTKRKTRKTPHKDDKIVTGLNGLMIGSLVYAGKQLNVPEYTRTAAKAADFILNNLNDSENHLLRVYRANVANVPAFLDDYTYFIEGLLQLFESTDEKRWLEESKRLADIMLNEFEDKQNGGFFFSAESVKNLIVRSKNLSEGGNVPSACGTAAVDLLELYRLTDEFKYEKTAQKTVQFLYNIISQNPLTLTSGLYAAALYLKHKFVNISL